MQQLMQVRQAIAVLSLTLATLVFSLGSVAQPMPRDAAPIGDLRFTLVRRAAPHVIELRAFDPRFAPSLWVLDSRNVQVGRARPNRRSLAVILPANLAGPVRVIVLAAATVPGATADVWVDGKLQAAGVRYSAGQPVAVPAGARGTLIGIGGEKNSLRHTLLVLSRDGNRVLDASTGSRTAVRLGPGVRVLYGSDRFGPFHDLVNAPESDSDGDLLEDSVEQTLGTCASRTATVVGVDCRTVADTRDTDGDGLMDGWEVMGFHSPWYVVPGGQYLPLQEWGADPRHKDVFVEIDFRRLTKADNDAALEMRMSPNMARQMAAVYADDATTDATLRARHAASVANPDGRPGIALHLDTGVPPETPADATIYGDWGGYNAVDAIPDPNDPAAYIPQTPVVWTTQMAAVRQGIFHYVLGYTTGGGACGKGIACGFNFNSLFVSTHEFGHTFGLDHDGTFDVAEPNCKPNYPSLMNYAAPLTQFSDGRDLGILNDHSLAETAALTPNSEIFDWLQNNFRYKVDAAAGSVDWNRDNRFAPSATTVRANANYLPGNNCESTRDGEMPTDMLSARSPAIVNLDGHLWVFSSTTDNKLAYVMMPTAFNCVNVDGCPDLSFYPPTVRQIATAGLDAAVIVVNGRKMILIVGIRPDGTLFETWMEYTGGLYVWDGPNDIPASPAAGEPSLAVSRDGSRVVLAYKGTDGVVHFRNRSPAAFGPERTVIFNGQPLSLPATVSPALAFAYLRFPTDVTVTTSERLIGAFAGGAIDLYTPLTGDNWSKLPVAYERARTVAGRPSLAWVVPPARPVATDERDLNTPPLPNRNPSTYGRLYVAYTEQGQTFPSEPLPNPVRMMMSYVDTAGTLRIGLDSYFDNVWSFAYGIDLLQPGEIALRAAETYSIRGAVNKVYVRPHADGIVDLPYRNFDDWKVLAWGSCDDLSSMQPIRPHIICAPKGW
jgi:hypothetical protein